MMRRILSKDFIFIGALGLLFLCSSCSDEEKSAPNSNSSIDDDYFGFQSFDMSDYGIAATIFLPDETANIGASTKPEVTRYEDHLWRITIGLNFIMKIEDMANISDLILSEKRAIESKKFFKINYLVNEPELIVYERELIVSGADDASEAVGQEHRSYHVYGLRTVNGITYAFKSREEGDTKKIIELMAKSIRSFKEK
jgi:hypothetical protein